jgi:hypothetical protein
MGRLEHAPLRSFIVSIRISGVHQAFPMFDRSTAGFCIARLASYGVDAGGSSTRHGWSAAPGLFSTSPCNWC